jgi:hypothetical protein
MNAHEKELYVSEVACNHPLPSNLYLIRLLVQVFDFDSSSLLAKETYRQLRYSCSVLLTEEHYDFIVNGVALNEVHRFMSEDHTLDEFTEVFHYFTSYFNLKYYCVWLIQYSYRST